MIRNYNGNVNREIIRDLRNLCKVNAENFERLLERYAQEGSVSFYTNLDPFLGMPDEMSKVVTLKSEEEIKEYLKKDLKGSIEKYLKSEEVSKDYLLGNLISFIKEKGVFPSQDEMRQLEIKAEAKRVAEHGIFLRDITWNDVLKEILELAEEIMEVEKEKNPRSVTQYIDPYSQERLWVDTDKFRGNIIHRVDYDAKKDFRDYKCAFKIIEDYEVENVLIKYWLDGTAHITARDWRDEKLAISDSLRINEYITMIHKGIVELAEKEGIEFMSEVEDYQVIK